MAHHSGGFKSDDRPGLPPELLARFRAAEAKAHDVFLREQAEKLKLGATGDYPFGVFSDGDEGGIKIAIAHTDGKVIVNFGTPVEWVGFTAEQAKDIAKALVRHATAIERGE